MCESSILVEHEATFTIDWRNLAKNALIFPFTSTLIDCLGGGDVNTQLANVHQQSSSRRDGENRQQDFTILSSKVHHQFLSDVFQAEVHVEHDQFTLPFLERQIYSSDCDLDWWCLKRKVICPSLWTIIPQLRVYNRYSNGTIANRWLFSDAGD